MESCLLICRNDKPKERKGKVLLIDARKELRAEKTISYLDDSHIEKICAAYASFETIDGFTYVASDQEIVEKDGSLNIPLYIKAKGDADVLTVDEAFEKWTESSAGLTSAMEALFNDFK